MEKSKLIISIILISIMVALLGVASAIPFLNMNVVEKVTALLLAIAAEIDLLIMTLMIKQNK